MDITLIAIFFAVIGLVVGSFLNVVILRLEQGMTLGGRSMCPKCHSLIHWYDNIPLLSFLMLRGKCRVCQANISWQYPLVELVTSLSFAFFGALTIGKALPVEIIQTIWYLFLVALLITITVSDIRNMEIPLVLLLVGVGGAIVAALLMTYVSDLSWFDLASPWQTMLFGGGIAALLFYSLVYYSKETWMGMGDVWLAGIVGAAVGLPALLVLFTLSFFSGAVIGIGLILLNKKGMKSQIPFAPFLSLGTIITLILLTLNPWWLSLVLIPIV